MKSALQPKIEQDWHNFSVQASGQKKLTYKFEIFKQFHTILDKFRQLWERFNQFGNARTNFDKSGQIWIDFDNGNVEIEFLHLEN